MTYLYPFLAESLTKLDLLQVFKASPVIYLSLFLLSLFSFAVWLYSLMTLRQVRMVPGHFLSEIHTLFVHKKFEDALALCKKDSHFLAQILASGISARSHGRNAIIETLQREGKRCGTALWQRISLLNDVAVISPMLGLLGTVLGLFYAFYDVNRSPDTLASIFDGLGIAVGTTVAGLIVAIFAMIFYATLKFKIIKLLNKLESESLQLGNLLE